MIPVLDLGDNLLEAVLLIPLIVSFIHTEAVGSGSTQGVFIISNTSTSEYLNIYLNIY